jgi:multidrug efflux system membrane fusion protein
MSRAVVLCLIVLAVLGGGVVYSRLDGSPMKDMAKAMLTVGDLVKSDASDKAKAVLPPAPPKATATKGPPPAPVLISEVEIRNVPVILTGIGSVQPRATVAVKSRLDGQIVEAPVKEGQNVKKGDLLFRIDPRPYEAALRVAEAALLRDQANYKKAQADMARIGDLAGKGFSPQAKLEETKAAMNALAATIKSDEAAIELAKLNLEYTYIRSPIDGKVGNILLAGGNMVKANDTQAMIVITEMDPIYVAFALPEQYLNEIKARLAQSKIPVEVSPPERTAEPVKGELFFVNNVVDMTTGTIQLMATFANPKQLLTPGQYVTARLTLRVIENAVVVPAKTVQVGARGSYVYVVKPDKTVEVRAVKIGPAFEDRAVILDGLKKGETVVTDGQLRLFPGARIAPKDEKTLATKPKAQS